MTNPKLLFRSGTKSYQGYRTRGQIAFTLLSGLLVAACAGAAQMESMVVPTQRASTPANSPLIGSICLVSVTGGGNFNATKTIRIETDSFREALRKSLMNNHLLSSNKDACEYDLSAQLMDVTGPEFFALDVEQTSHINYYLVSRQSGDFRKESISATNVEKSGAFLGVVRNREAQENSINENIRMFIQRITALEGKAS